MSDLVLVKLDQARLLLSEAKTVQEAKQIFDVAEAARAYARHANLSAEAVNYAAEIKIRAERLLGEMLQQTPKNTGIRLNGRDTFGSTVMEPPKVLAPTLAEIGITKKQSSRAQQLASLPVETLEAHIQDQKERGEEITVGKLLRDTNAANNRTERIEHITRIASNNQPLAAPSRFPVIYADPPWQYDDNSTDPTRVIENQYPTMTIEALCDLPVADIATPDAILFMWATSPLLSKATRLLEAWGFYYQTNMVWVKDRIGMGWWVRQQHELLLIATRGHIPHPLPADRHSSVITAPRGEHSAKPDQFYDVIERMYPELPKIEMFSRSPRDGWYSWGNQA